MKIIFILFSLLTASISFAQDQIHISAPPQDQTSQGWYKQSSGITGGIPFVSFINKDTGFASSLFTTNGGDTWQLSPNSVEVVRFIDKNFGYGYSPKGTGYISTTNDGGKTWVDNYTGYDNLKVFYFCTPSLGYGFFGTFGRIICTRDGGKTWSTDTTSVGTIDGFACWDSLHIIAGGENYKNPDDISSNRPYIASIFYSGNSGNSWSFNTSARQINSRFEPQLTFGNSIVWFIGGTAGGSGVIKSTTSGSYVHIDTMGFGVGAIGGADSNNITVVGGGGNIYRTFDGGKKWIQQNSGTPNDLQGVSFVDSTTGWAVGRAGVILHTTNAGYSWVRQHIPQPLEVKAIPEPFATKTTLSYSIPKAAKVDVKLYDVLGKEVYHLESSGIQSEGAHSIEISGENLPGGVYYFILTAGEFTGMGKVTKIVP